MKLHAASAEQEAIIKCQDNIIVDAVAGSGKTTTILHIARQCTTTLVLTYNARLRLETRERLKAAGGAADVHTYHSFAVSYLDPSCYTDYKMLCAMDAPLCCGEYDLIIIDEAQDMNSTYHKLVCKIREISPRARMIVLGDKFQSIYQCSGADPRYITMADQKYDNGRKWARLDLGTSYRLTRECAAFVNFVLGRSRLRAIKDGPRPRYVFWDQWGENRIVEEVCDLLTGGYAPGDIFILAPSVRSASARSPIALTSAALVQADILIYIPTSDDQRLNQDVIKGKIVFSSFHQAKGLERKHVIVMGFDISYCKYYNVDKNQGASAGCTGRECANDQCNNGHCSNALYVALTRATTSMSIYHGKDQPGLPYVDMSKLAQYVEIVGAGDERAAKPQRGRQPIAATELCRHLPVTVVKQCIELLTLRPVRCGESMDIDAVSKQHRWDNGLCQTYHEEVATITGTALTMYCEWYYYNCVTVYARGRWGDPPTRRALTFPAVIPWDMDYWAYPRAVGAPLDAEDILRVANYSMYCADSKLLFKIKQIQYYNWISDVQLGELTERLVAEIAGGDPVFEVGLERYKGPYHICGAADLLVDGRRLYEIKTVQEIAPEHYIQLAIYMWLCGVLEDEPEACYLYNVRSDELVEVKAGAAALDALMNILLHHKYHAAVEVTDGEFVGQGASARSVCYVCAESLKKEHDLIIGRDLRVEGPQSNIT